MMSHDASDLVGEFRNEQQQLAQRLDCVRRIRNIP